MLGKMKDGSEPKIRWSHALKPDAQAFDKVEIVTIPRYKESYLSGDEWRISATVRLYRNGIVMYETSCRDIEHACKYLAWFHDSAIDDGKAYFAGEHDFCDQEGCADFATIYYRKLFEYGRDGVKKDIAEDRPEYRQFCDRHKTRGDCGLDDADRNYVQLAQKPEK